MLGAGALGGIALGMDVLGAVTTGLVGSAADDGSSVAKKQKIRRGKDQAAAHNLVLNDTSERLDILLDMYFVPVAPPLKPPSKLLQEDVMVSRPVGYGGTASSFLTRVVPFPLGSVSYGTI